MLTHTLTFFSWNVRGLGQEQRCSDVLSELISQRPTLVALQETKLNQVERAKLRSFLPARLSSHSDLPSVGAAGGILTAWDDSVCSLRSSTHGAYTLTSSFSLKRDGTCFTLTNVYAPTAYDEKVPFLRELDDIASVVSEPWILIGDFNLTRNPLDKNSDNFNFREAQLFNDSINRLELIEIPLVDRAYTWSNKRDNPTLVRLDRCFVNVLWDDTFPNTALSTLPRTASDHVPLVLAASTNIPKSRCFRFENNWLRHATFKEAISQSIDMNAHASIGKNFVKMLKNCRTTCRSWAKRIGPVFQREIDTKILLQALDLLEEERALSHAEASLRHIVIRGLQDIQKEKFDFWRQRFNLRIAMEWDENSRFFHASASGRRRKNAIPCLERDGALFYTHEAKSTILHDFYKDLLGTDIHITWDFALHDIYIAQASRASLSVPFTDDEIAKALFEMDMHASPGPDGFGPSFYKNFWSKTKPLLAVLFDHFYYDHLDLDGLNRAHLILLPKSEGVTTASGFRPISLQNCPMKLFSKVLANRVKGAIPALIDDDQTGFVLGRNIAENFVYAADLLSCCHKRQLPTAVLKLDFKKAFDSVSWTSLDMILKCRGFDKRWRGWIHKILSTGKTSVLLNGVPGRWITCKRGLRQGDPLSPYLFIIVADVLQRLIKHAAPDGGLQHPVIANQPCPVLQYADDTLIMLRGDVPAIRSLKSVLDSFSRATGLEINFHKSTFVPMHIPASEAACMAEILGCDIGSFPQTYLGLPLSPHKLRVSDYQPLICRVDSYLAGWKARLLSTGGRLTLVNAVLSSIPVYYMSSCLLPKTVIESIDGRRRSFLWTGEEKCHGSQCLVAWSKICQDKEEGGGGGSELRTLSAKTTVF